MNMIPYMFHTQKLHWQMIIFKFITDVDSSNSIDLFTYYV